MDAISRTPHPVPSPHAVEPTDGPVTWEELRMAYRCPGMPLDALGHDLTPTGLHYQVAHFDIPTLEAEAWRLDVHGLVRTPLSLTLDDIRSRPSVTRAVTLECAGNGRGYLQPRPVGAAWFTDGVSTAAWTGVSLASILEDAGIHPGAVELVFSGADHGIQGGELQDYQRALPVADARRADVLLAWEMNGRPLEPQHGFPLRLVVPGWYGMASVKWLTSIEAIEQPFEGFQQAVAYRYQAHAADPGEPVTRIRVKSIMRPPGIAEFMTEERHMGPGLVRLMGRAWSGQGAITSVEVGVDDEWHPATLHDPIGAGAWRAWSYDWGATPGRHMLMCRATDASGDRQPLEQVWNRQGMGNNMVQRVSVTVR